MSLRLVGNGTSAPARTFDVKSAPYNAAGSGSVNDRAAIQAAMDAALAAGGGVVYLPKGIYRLDSQLDARSGVSLVGAGPGKTILKPQGAAHAISAGGTVGAPLTDITFSDFTIDGINQTGLVKGIFCTHMLRTRFVRVHCYDTGASGLGVDFLVDSSFVSCIVERAGRNGLVTDPGCSGFGIGTGHYAEENLTFTDCVARDCKRYGFFLERQASATFTSKFAKFVNCHAEGNQRGFGDNGSNYTIFDACTSTGNTADGFYVGADQANLVGYKGAITGCVSVGNGINGIYLDYRTATTAGQYIIADTRVETNENMGIKVEMSSTVDKITIQGCDISDSGKCGIQFTGGTAEDPDVLNNRIYNNGRLSVGGADQGIIIGAAMTRPRIVNNRIGDIRAAGSRKQNAGIRINAGQTLTGGEIRGNDLRNNGAGGTTNALDNAGTLTACRVEQNFGYNSGLGLDTLSPAASPWTYTAGPTPEIVYILNGTVSNVAVDGTNVALAAPATLTLQPNSQMVVTYSVAPGAVKRQRL